MPFYDHECGACGHIWEDFYSMVTDPPTVCPECKAEGQVKRLIPDNISVRVPLKGRELKAKIAEDSKKLAQQVKTDENLKANIVGEERYHTEEKAKKELSDNLKQL